MSDPHVLGTDDAGETTHQRAIHSRYLGLYLALCVAYQIGIYFCSNRYRTVPGGFDDAYTYWKASWFRLGNPRAVFELISRGAEDIAYWLSAAWLFALATAMIVKPGNRLFLRLYIGVEVTLAALGGADFLLRMALRAGFSSSEYRATRDADVVAHGVVLLVFSVLPIVYGFWLL
jgi:hypothetical protein